MNFRGSIAGQFAAAFVSIAVLLAAAGAAEAGVIFREKSTYYDISGKTGKALYAFMEKNGPRMKGKKHVIATASYDFKTRNVRPEVTARHCRILDVDVIVTVTYRLPRWRGAAKATPALRRAWGEFIGFVERHEKQHGRIAREFGDEMLRTMKSLRGDRRKDCKDMVTKMARLGPQVVKRHNERQAAFDASSWGLGGQNYRFDRQLIATQ